MELHNVLFHRSTIGCFTLFLKLDTTRTQREEGKGEAIVEEGAQHEERAHIDNVQRHVTMNFVTTRHNIACRPF